MLFLFLSSANIWSEQNSGGCWLKNMENHHVFYTNWLLFVMFLYFHTNKIQSSINYIKNMKNKSSKIENYSYSMCYFYRDILGSMFT